MIVGFHADRIYLMANEDEALRRIRETREQNGFKLDLSGLSLTELPTEIYQLTNLNELHLAKNQLTELPAEIGQLSQIEKLSLYRNFLK